MRRPRLFPAGARSDREPAAQFQATDIMRTEKNRLRVAVLLAGALSLPGIAQAEDPPYKVVDGNKVDARTLDGWRTWRALACERCHGPQQQGMVGPSLIDALKRLSREEFNKTVLEGRPEKGMPNFNGSEQVTKNLDGLYGFLKGRSDGAIKPGRLEELKE
jgi:mono/diheme cytochrome c family protein